MAFVCDSTATRPAVADLCRQTSKLGATLRQRTILVLMHNGDPLVFNIAWCDQVDLQLNSNRVILEVDLAFLLNLYLQALEANGEMSKSPRMQEFQILAKNVSKSRSAKVLGLTFREQPSITDHRDHTVFQFESEHDSLDSSELLGLVRKCQLVSIEDFALLIAPRFTASTWDRLCRTVSIGNNSRTMSLGQLEAQRVEQGLLIRINKFKGWPPVH
ncbi:hypothetical protein B0T26DRAFT_445924 [Lasiosphaeria miniovina]|uniref:Uncharacterized protein n=1 Tax=Lasiosphaeria miniovina TaxID=1954250 RepID=A0AA39ZZ46_9PEZI|nr:uncharacterized protein B0T26DRAFT_445924 [Lasiosphaeria miniovina]KAK0706245.1 hypothetical protein B0T26DRAFT_445924 [Lasiosphaeria miniovina]